MTRPLAFSAATILILGWWNLLHAQVGPLVPVPPIAVWNNFSTTVKGMTIGPSHCYFWAHSPAPAQVQIACWTGSALLKNLIVTANGDIGGFAISPVAVSAPTFPVFLKLSIWVTQQQASVPGFTAGATDALTEVRIPSDIINQVGGMITWTIAPMLAPSMFSYTVIGWPGAIPNGGFMEVQSGTF